MEIFYIGCHLHMTQGRGFCADRASETEACLKKKMQNQKKKCRDLLKHGNLLQFISPVVPLLFWVES